jgi:hypothetical protein
MKWDHGYPEGEIKMKKLLSIIVGCLMMCGVVGQAQAIFIDNGSYTTITELNMDVYDVYEFVGLTHQEVLNKVKTLGDGWFLASMNDVRPIFQLITEEKYVNTVKDMIGFNVLSPFGVALYNTGGRVKDTYPDSSYPNYNYLWGFGNGIQLYRADLQQVTYIWSIFGIGWDLADTRFDTMGAWVIRKSTCSGGIVTFTAGTPAKAADVNANFDALNCQIQALKAIVCKNEPTASVCQ